MSKPQVIETPKPVPVPALVGEPNPVLAMIERAARDPSVDVTKMRELLALAKEQRDEDSRIAFDDAMTAAQGEMRAIAADATNPQTKSKYASFLALDRVMRPIYTRHDFALSFNTADGAPENYVRVVCDVSRKGHSRRYQADMPADGKGAKGGDVMTKTHAVGAAMTYGQRYLLKMIFNIAIGDDDDGNAPGAGEKISAADAQNLRDMIRAAGANEARFLKWARVTKIEDIPAEVYESCVEAIKSFKKSAS